MLRKISLVLIGMVAGAGSLFAQQTITIKGKIQFLDNVNKGDMQITRSAGFDRVTYVSVPANDNGTYQLSFKVEEPGQYTLMCQGGTERVNFWAEDESLEINFRGIDTAKIRYIGPTYVHIKGGPNNDLMNMVSWEQYRNYWTGVDLARIPYAEDKITDDEFKQELSMKIHSALGPDYYSRINHIARYYGYPNSALTMLSMVKNDQALYNELLARIEAKNPNYGPLLKYQQDIAEKEAQRNRLAAGEPTPHFSYETAKGDKNLGPVDFKGKYLVIDFWASWCGPCRSEIPHLKEAYAKYKDKGVEILSVSIDKDDAAWRKAMEQENMPWPQIKAPDVGQEVMALYQFSGIPHIVVIDKNGNIVGKDYRGKALMDKLEELTSGKASKPSSIPMMGM